MQPMTDATLAESAQRGDATAYAELVRRWSPRITAFCHSRVRRADVADELAQETLVRGYTAVRSLVDPARIGTWFLGIAHRVCLDWFAQSKRAPRTFGEFEHAAASIEAALTPMQRLQEHDPQRNARLEALVEAVDDLPDPFREIIMLYYYGTQTYADLADALGVSFATVNVRLTKARALLRERMHELEDQDPIAEPTRTALPTTRSSPEHAT